MVNFRSMASVFAYFLQIVCLKLECYLIMANSKINLVLFSHLLLRASQVVPAEKNPPANTRDTRDASLNPESGRSSGREGNGTASQYSCLENPMDRGDWQGTVTGSQRVRHN